MKENNNKFLADSIFTIISKSSLLILNVLSAVIIARGIGAEGRGIYSLVLLVPTTIATLANFGLPQASTYYLARERYSLEIIFWTTATLAVILSLIFLFSSLLFVHLYYGDIFQKVSVSTIKLGLVILPFLFLISFLSYPLLAIGRVKQHNIVYILQSITFTLILAILFISSKITIKYILWGYISSTILAVSCLWFLIPGSIKFKAKYINFNYAKDAFKYGIKVHVGNMVGFLHYKIDIFIIGIILNPREVGLYVTAVILVEKIWIVSQSVGLVLFPRVAKEVETLKVTTITPMVCRNVMFITFLLAVILYLYGEELIVWLFSKEFTDSIPALDILLIGAVLLSGWRILANDLYGRGMALHNLVISTISVVLNVCLNLMWIPKFGIYGAAWATTFSYSFCFLSIAVVAKKNLRYPVLDFTLIKATDFKKYSNFISTKYRHIIRGL